MVANFGKVTPITFEVGIIHALNSVEGKACRIGLKVKYLGERDWIVIYLWMDPDWKNKDVYEKGYKAIRKRGELMLEESAIVEEAKLSSILVI